jgi:aspartate/tyrosine/aromatic aminotransferase
MFEAVPTAPPDPILGITEAFQGDPRPGKINLSVGVYKDATGTTPILTVVKEAERRLLEQEKSKGYKPITGDPEYCRLVQALLFGSEHEIVSSGRAATAHTPGGTGALRVAADYLHVCHPGVTVWVSDPTWANHTKIFQAAGLQQGTYPYFDAKNSALDIEGMLNKLDTLPKGDVVLLHACCHNPSGVDPSPEQWQRIAQVVASRGLVPLVDFAYQGFGEGLEADAAGLSVLTSELDELLVCSSFSKNFGLYNERTGALTVVAKQRPAAQAVLSQLKICIRTNYSNPPAHGAAIVATILGDAELRSRWEKELADMRARIHAMREQFAAALESKGAKADFSFITRQKGMFSFSGLSRDQVERLKSDHAVYIVGSGRINVAGMTPDNMGPLTDAIVAVL